MISIELIIIVMLLRIKLKVVISIVRFIIKKKFCLGELCLISILVVFDLFFFVVELNKVNIIDIFIF